MRRATTEPWPRLCAWGGCTDQARNRFAALCAYHLVLAQRLRPRAR